MSALLWKRQSARTGLARRKGYGGVRFLEGALVAATPGGSVFSLDPADPERAPRSG
ncbi:hypothetical protein [Streptomyces luteogriseus]|uniref:hypothetical protein n=1 Tax=Streptomyces luteogriseus TaxID=68233 RepID=UPI0037BDABEF